MVELQEAAEEEAGARDFEVKSLKRDLELEQQRVKARKIRAPREQIHAVKLTVILDQA